MAPKSKKSESTSVEKNTVTSQGVAVPLEAQVVPQDAVVAPQDAVVAPLEAVVVPQDAVVAPLDAVVAPQDAVVAPQDAVKKTKLTKKVVAKVDAAKVDATKVDAAKVDAAKVDVVSAPVKKAARKLKKQVDEQTEPNVATEQTVATEQIVATVAGNVQTVAGNVQTVVVEDKKSGASKKVKTINALKKELADDKAIVNKKKTANKGKNDAANKVDDKVLEVVAEEDDADVDSKSRSFKVKLPSDEGFTGRFTGLTPYQAANKALSKYFRGLENNVDIDVQVNFSIRESTRGSKRHEYTYKGSRIKLEQPITYTIKSDNGESRVITKQYKNQLIKVKKSAGKQVNVTV